MVHASYDGATLTYAGQVVAFTTMTVIASPGLDISSVKRRKEPPISCKALHFLAPRPGLGPGTYGVGASAIDTSAQSPLPFLHAAPSHRPVISTCTLPRSPFWRSITAV
jgi:hypothetical protein